MSRLHEKARFGAKPPSDIKPEEAMTHLAALCMNLTILDGIFWRKGHPYFRNAHAISRRIEKLKVAPQQILTRQPSPDVIKALKGTLVFLDNAHTIMGTKSTGSRQTGSRQKESHTHKYGAPPPANVAPTSEPTSEQYQQAYLKLNLIRSLLANAMLTFVNAQNNVDVEEKDWLSNMLSDCAKIDKNIREVSHEDIDGIWEQNKKTMFFAFQSAFELAQQFEMDLGKSEESAEQTIQNLYLGDDADL
eukprot:3939604-Rhodomonas_salina.1